MAEELLETVADSVSDNSVSPIIEDAVHDSMVITVPVDSSLTVSGAAADAKATGDAIRAKADVSDLTWTLSVNGKTGGGTMSIIINGSDIPAASDEDEETVSDALERIDSEVSGLAGDLADETSARSNAVSAEQTARSNADTALGGRIDNTNTAVDALTNRVAALEADDNLLVIVTVSGAGTEVIQDARITANHYLTHYQFLDGNGNPTGAVLADMTLTTSAGSVSVTVDNAYGSGSCKLWFAYAEEVTGT